MIKVDKRGTDTKKLVRGGIKIATKRLRLMLGISLLINIGLGFYIYKFL